MNKIIVGRHPAMAEFIRAECPEFADAPVLTGTVTEADVCGRDVIGVLPYRLATLCGRFRAVEFSGTPPRGAEYTLDQMRVAGARIVEYRVEMVK